VQGSDSWEPPTGTLGQILTETGPRVEALRARARDLGREAGRRAVPPSFRMALDRSEVAVIAEVKRKSPSKGVIKAGLGAVEQAKAYHAGGAAAISILTEPNHFDGSTADLEIVGSEVHIPLLKKDFHVDTIQLLEARAAGASAVLLIARALRQSDLVRLMADADRLLLDALVEVRDRTELQRALDAGATIIGINNRNLETLEIDPATSEELLPLIPSGVIAIAESGVSRREDVERVAKAGADAVLVGSALSAAEEPTSAVRALTGVYRTKGQRGLHGY
jgi:indole-3-glycerol phosphate synthase